jgi:hypothetical protein
MNWGSISKGNKSVVCEITISSSTHLWRYSPFWVQASLRRLLRFTLSSARLLHRPFPNSQIVFCLPILSEASLRFFQLQLFYGVRSASRPTPNVEDQSIYPFSSGSSPSTCPAWEALPVATLPPAFFSGSFDHASPIERMKT